MISKICVSRVATFNENEQIIDDLKKLNFFYGANASGKTTISRIIANPAEFTSCFVSWENDVKLETRVYNRDFIDRNFNQSILGIFTLGEQQADTIKKIDTATVLRSNAEKDMIAFKNSLEGKDGLAGKKQELLSLENKYESVFWEAKKAFGERLSGGLTKFVGSKKDFKAKILSENTTNEADLLPIEELGNDVRRIFSNSLEVIAPIEPIQHETILSLENDSILGKRIIGKQDVNIADMIVKLGNSGWVRQGITFYEKNNKICPFCQKKTDDDFAESLSKYFDETFEQDISSINTLLSSYVTEANQISLRVQEIITSKSPFIHNGELVKEKELLDAKIDLNRNRIEQKAKKPDQSITLESLKEIFYSIDTLIKSANVEILKNNQLVDDISGEEIRVAKKCWKFIIDNLKTSISDYYDKKSNLEKDISEIKQSISVKEKEIHQCDEELRRLEKQIVSNKPTLEAINRLLLEFGYTSFFLDLSSDGRNYKIVRADGKDAKESLSEGERNFVTFLYFYHLLKGSQSESGMTSNKVVVFDDPVSSLDCDVLFIVSTLIRDLFDDVQVGRGDIKQIFVLTHNVYFHKEVSYGNVNNEDKPKKHVTFWLVKKNAGGSYVEKQGTNPVKTTYQLLWEEIKAPKRNNSTIRNALRRILENYFKLIGGIPLKKLYEQFSGDDKLKCKSLCSWIHDGSHSVFNDEDYTILDDNQVEVYLRIFKDIFEKRGQIAHYQFMMGEAAISSEES